MLRPQTSRSVAPDSIIDATGPGLLEFIRDADILIFDGQYDRQEYARTLPRMGTRLPG